MKAVIILALFAVAALAAETSVRLYFAYLASHCFALYAFRACKVVLPTMLASERNRIALRACWVLSKECIDLYCVISASTDPRVEIVRLYSPRHSLFHAHQLRQTLIESLAYRARLFDSFATLAGSVPPPVQVAVRRPGLPGRLPPHLRTPEVPDAVRGAAVPQVRCALREAGLLGALPQVSLREG